jgi:hypothetical protein
MKLAILFVVVVSAISGLVVEKREAQARQISSALCVRPLLQK